jgi:hypothetical protein
MSNRWIVFGAVFLVLLILAVFAFTSLEIYENTVYRSPSRQALVNNFFALEQWLAKTGHPVRRLAEGNAGHILGAPEKAVFVQSDAFDWEGSLEPLKQWMEAGGFLLVHADYEAENGFWRFLENFGVSVFPSDNSPEEYYSTAAAEGLSVAAFYWGSEFGLSEEAEASAFTLVERWPGGQAIRLVQIPVGAGALTFIGWPRFMGNRFLKEEVNARLAWDLTGARTGKENPGVLFIRRITERAPGKSLFGRLADRGNFFPLGLSALVLVVIGFWMVIPPFGLVFSEQKSPVRPILDRFRAEIQFLKKYRALETYPELYLKEIKQRLRGREPPPGVEAVEQALRKKGRLSYSEIVWSLQILRTGADSKPGFWESLLKSLL